MHSSSIRIFPDTILRQKCLPVHDFGPSLEGLVRKMRQIMKNQKMGIGIAAPQIGTAVQAALVDVSSRVAGAREHILINPVILEAEGVYLSHEGCMSLPEYTGYVERASRVRVRCQLLSGEFTEYTCEGLEAVCVQHELDHLQGKLFFDRVVTLKTDMQPRHWKKKRAKR